MKTRISTRKRNTLLLTFAVILCLAASHLYNRNSHQNPVSTATEETITARSKTPVPDITLNTQRGPIRIQDMKGKTIILNFWASWCAPCAVEMPKQLAMMEMQKEDTILILLSSDDDENKMHTFLKKLPTKAQNMLKKPNIILAHDKNKEITQDIFQTYRLPETIIITPEGVMDRKIVGDSVDWQGKEIATYLQELSAKK